PPVEADDLPLEGAALDREQADVEVAAVTPHCEHDAAEAVPPGDHGELVAAPRTELGKVRVQRMVVMARVVRSLAEHRAQLGGAALGGPAAGVAGPGRRRGGGRGRGTPAARS